MKLMGMLLALAILGQAVSGKERIVGGSPATPGSFPFVVSLTANGQHFCGGYVYSTKWIVTSASCVQHLQAADILVIAGTVSLSNLIGAQMIPVSQIVFHEQYNNATKENNIALLQLSRDLNFDANVQLVTAQSPTYNALGTVAGWGSEVQGGSKSLELLEATVMIRTDDACFGYGNDYTASSMVCAGTTTHDICEGDEGSPLLQYDPLAVVGIASHNRGCANPSFPTAYTKIGYFSLWLYVHAGAHRAPLPVK